MVTLNVDRDGIAWRFDCVGHDSDRCNAFSFWEGLGAEIIVGNWSPMEFPVTVEWTCDDHFYVQPWSPQTDQGDTSMTKKTKPKLNPSRTIVVYQDGDGWRWDVVARNSQTAWTSPRSYREKGKAVRAARIHAAETGYPVTVETA